LTKNILKISKEKVIDLTSYERKSLFRFLVVYLASVFILLGIIGYLFFKNNHASLQEAMKFEMMYRARMLSSEIAIKSMRDKTQQPLTKEQLFTFLKTLNHCRFEVGYYDHQRQPVYAEFQGVQNFNETFYCEGKHCFTVAEDKDEHLGIRYIVLKEYDLMHSSQELRIRIIGYLILSFLLMGAVGYFLGRLFLRPVREQIESLDSFISDTTHELNTPISAILMTIQSLKGIEPKKLKRLEASAKRLSVMYSSLTYRLEGKTEHPVQLDLASVIHERVEYVRELIESKRFEVTLNLEATSVFMSKTSASRLIDNLLSNAIKYSDVGDSIIITLRNRTLKVQDTGIGIDKSVQDDIFRRYYRANEERGGFGIGLNIVLSVCQQYKIKLDLESEKGKGSTFILTFPKNVRR